MIPMTRRNFLGITATGLGGLWLADAWRMPANTAGGSSSLESLYQQFRDPDRKYSIRPFWFWNGKPEAEEIGRQIRHMVEHGVYGAYVHSRHGLETPYSSEAWWQRLGATPARTRRA